MKVHHIFLTLQLLISWSSAQRQMLPNERNITYGTRFRGIECKNYDNKTAYLTFCFIKNYSRKLSTMNFGIQVMKPVTIFFRLAVSYRYGVIYREVLDSKIVDFCELMNTLESNKLLKFILDLIRKTAKGLFHKCPYEGLMEYYNITVDDELMKTTTLFPEGQYRYNVSIFDTPKKIVLNMQVFTEVRSPLKTSFG